MILRAHEHSKHNVSHREHEDLFLTDKENLQNKSDKKFSGFLGENSDNNFLAPDEEKLVQIFETNTAKKEDFLNSCENEEMKNSLKKNVNISTFNLPKSIGNFAMS